MNSGTIRIKTVVLAACLFGFTFLARADASAPGSPVQSHSPVRCDQEIENAIARSNTGRETPWLEGPQTAKRSNDPQNPTSPTSAQTPTRSDCARHPWVRQADAWHAQGMTVEAAMQWLIVAPENTPMVRLYPQLDAHMEDLARMRAAYTLAVAGHTPDAIRLWTDLSIRRPQWAEVWFNLGLASFAQGEHARANRHFGNANLICQRRACALESEQIERWRKNVQEQP